MLKIRVVYGLSGFVVCVLFLYLLLLGHSKYFRLNENGSPHDTADDHKDSGRSNVDSGQSNTIYKNSSSQTDPPAVKKDARAGGQSNSTRSHDYKQPDVENKTASSLKSRPENCFLLNSSDMKKGRRDVVIGGMSHVGLQLALKLQLQGSKVFVLEDLLNIDTDSMKWDRWSELIEKKLDVSIVEFKDEGRLRLALQKASPSTITYVPTLLFHPVTSGPGSLRRQPSFGVVVIKEFLHVIEIVRKQFSRSHFVLLSGVSSSSIYKQWLKTMEDIFWVYKHTHRDFKATLVKLPSYFGPWQDLSLLSNNSLDQWWYIDDVTKILQQILNGGNCSFNGDSVSRMERTSVTQASSETLHWAQQYMAASRALKNATFGAYFVRLSSIYYHRKVMGERFSYIRKWLISGFKYGLENCLFHDRLGAEFIKRVRNNFKNSVFLKVKARNKKSPNDQRFYFMYDYLLTRRDIGMVVLSDTKDIEFLNDPALVMKAMGDYFYVGKDVSFILDAGSLQREDYASCFHDADAWRRQEALRLFGFLNVGVLGGTRAAMLASLAYMTYCLDRTNTDSCCCDMSSSQYIYHAQFFDQLFIGYPFNSAFKNGQPGPLGMAVKHKATFDEI